ARLGSSGYRSQPGEVEDWLRRAQDITEVKKGVGRESRPFVTTFWKRFDRAACGSPRQIVLRLADRARTSGSCARGRSRAPGSGCDCPESAILRRREPRLRRGLHPEKRSSG